ncbi:MAG: hypothetical protein J0L73_23720 [Verrucomicrobia bacterium]|nr:hypothetical protein [Verrucomicrobiota bacterium]
MNRLGLLCMIVYVAALASSEGEETNQGKPTRYFQANHGCNGGLEEMVDLSQIEGFEEVRTISDVAKFAAKVPGAVGFMAHPDFEKGDRFASAVVWYSHRSRTSESWTLHLFDEAEAKKGPGEAATPAALLAAELRVTAKLPTAQALIDKGGALGVNVSPADGDYNEQMLMALAVMRLGGFFAHSGQFGKGHCFGCRSVVRGGIPEKCGLGVRKVPHWTCCGAEAGTLRCRYWELIKAQNDVGPRMEMQR